MADFDKIKRNVARMVDQSAPEADIDSYLNSEGVTAAQLRSYQPAQQQSGVGRFASRTDLQKLPDVGSAEAFVRNMSGAATFGWNDPFVAGVKTLFGDGDYKSNLAEQDLRSAVARRNPAAQVLGDTAGMMLQGLMTLPSTAIRVGQTGAQALREGVDTALRYGAAYGTAQGLGSSRSETVGGQVADMATGGANGALMGLAGYGVLSGVGAGLAKYQQGRDARRTANALRLQEMHDAGVVDPLPATVSNSRLMQMASRLSEVTPGGKSIGDKAARNVGDVQSRINDTLSRPIGGREAGDLGTIVQDDLRRNLTQRSISSNDLASMSKSELESIAGPVTDQGFMPPRPNVAPVQPRNVDPVQPVDVGPAPTQPMSTDSVSRLNAQRDFIARSIDDKVARHNAANTSYKTADDAINSGLESVGIRDVRKGSDGIWYANTTKAGEKPVYIPINDGAYPSGLTSDQYIAVKRAIQHKNKFDKLNIESARRVDEIRKLHEKRDAIDNLIASKKAQDAGENARYQTAKVQYDRRFKEANDAAAAETAARREQARLDAESQTAAARAAADNAYNERLKSGDVGFRHGRSRETYPTESSAAYELAGRELPKGIRVNPLGDGYSKTSTINVLEDIAREGKRSLRIRDYNGQVFGDNGGLEPTFAAYMSKRIGRDLTARLDDMARRRGAGVVNHLTPDGIKTLLSDLRRAAREAETAVYPALPRTEDAAILRRLATSVQDDFYGRVKKTGQPESFSTARGDYKVLPDGRTQFGNETPADKTYFLSQDSLSRLTRGANVSEKTTSLPATLSLRADKASGQVGRFNNQTGQFDRSSLVPFNENPEPGMIPIQVWADGTRVKYGSPVVSRGQTSGERAVGMMKNVDEQYSKFINSMRRPLAKIYGDKVEPVQAMNRLAKAAKDGETAILTPFMRVMSEKSDPNKGTAAVLMHMTGGAKDLAKFVEVFGSLPAPTKRVLFASEQGQQLYHELSRYVNVGKRILKYTSSDKPRPAIDPTRLSHIMTAAAVYTNLPTVIGGIAGNAALARVLSSPRLLRWMTEIPTASRGGFQTDLFRQHLAKLGALAGNQSDKIAIDALRTAVGKLIIEKEGATDGG